MVKVCRLCLQNLHRGSKYFNINAVESFTGFMPYRDQLTTCIPEIALDLIPNPVICNNCRSALKSAYDFKSRCLLVEKKIQEYIESQNGSDELNYDLSQISMTDLPPLNKIPILQRELEQEDALEKLESINNSQLLMQLQKEVSFPTTGEIEITNVVKRNGKYSLSPKDGNYLCPKCGKVFIDPGKLLLHKATHGDEFVCNFCNQSFKSLQYLRRHNSMCSKASSTEDKKSILNKRPHLPTRAKNQLKRWLFKHTDHPYPTDHEKQMLMQQTNLSLLQVENWFINARRRILQDLTKLKKHGLRCEDVADNTLGLELDLEEIITSPSPPRTVKLEPQALLEEPQPEDPEDIEEAIGASAIMKPDPDMECVLDPLDISAVKAEGGDDR